MNNTLGPNSMGNLFYPTASNKNNIKLIPLKYIVKLAECPEFKISLP